MVPALFIVKCAHCKAVDSGASEEAIVAALLHDIGWKLSMSAPVDKYCFAASFLSI
jgi:predicted HD phosphohydrolase